MRTTFLLSAMLFLAGCGEMTPVDNATTAAAALPTEPAQAPVAPPPANAADGVMLEQIGFAEMEAADLLGAGCTFHRDALRDPILVLQADGGAARIGGAIVALAPDANAGLLEYDARSVYSGGGLRYTVTRGQGEGRQVGTETVSWPATLEVTPPTGTATRIAGELQCGA